MNTCEKCNREFEGEGKYCPECASVLEPTKLEDRKLSPKRFILIFCDFAIIAICLLVFLIPTFTDKNRNTSGQYELETYVSGGVLYCKNLGDEKSEPVVLSEALGNDAVVYAEYSEDGTVVFFSSETNDNDNYTLCYYDFKTNGPVTEIAADVYGNDISADGTRVAYVRGEYELHISDLENDTVIEDNVAYYELTDDGTKLYYADEEGRIYVKNGEAEPALVSENGYVEKVFDDLSALYISVPLSEKEEAYSVIKADFDGNTTEILTDIVVMPAVYGSGEFYYITQNGDDAYNLNYYNGLEGQVVAEGIKDIFAPVYASGTAAVVYPLDGKYYHATGAAEKIEIGAEADLFNIELNNKGTHIFYYNKDEQYADLYEINLAEGTEGKLIDKDIDCYSMPVIGTDNRVLYAKKSAADELKYDLYLAGTLIAENIDFWFFAEDLSTGLIELYEEDGTSTVSAFLYDTVVPVAEGASDVYAEFDNGIAVYYNISLQGESDGAYKYTPANDSVMIAVGEAELV